MPVNRSILTCICTGVALASLSTAQARDLNIVIRTPDGSPSEAAVVLFRSVSGDMVPATLRGDVFSAVNVGSKLVIEVSHPTFGVATVYGTLQRNDNVVAVSFVSPNTARLLKSAPRANTTAAAQPGRAALGGNPACTDSNGDCCTASGGLGCNDEACCNLVCGLDAFCCDVAWDQLCADSANLNCPDLCGAPGSNCCFPNGGIGCDDPTCQGIVCGLDAFCCDVAWDQLCADSAEINCGDLCPTQPNCCGQPGTGGCCVADGTPCCENLDCCNIVCALDPFCCDTAWDGICVSEAQANCPPEACPPPPPDPCGAPVCDPGKTPENEPNCGLPVDFINGGCNSAPNVFSPIVCGQAYCGTGAFDGALRDTDWYSVTTVAPTVFTMSVTSEFAAVMGLIEYLPGFEGSGSCAGISGSINPFALAPACTTTSVTTPCLSPGTWFFFVGADFNAGILPCGDFEYTVTLTCASPCEVPTGACCFGDGGCVDGITAAECGAQGGEYQGDNTQCGEGPGSNCCFDNGGLGCDDPDCQAIVCAADAFCCDVAWDTICADEAQALCGDLCQDVTCPTICGPTNPQSCCLAGGLPGCNDAECCNLVCSLDPFCCDVAWDGLCASAAVANCGPLCQAQCDLLFPEQAPFPFACGPGAGGCLDPDGTPGCDDCKCCQTVCGLDPFCCDVGWDGICVGEAAICTSCDLDPPCQGLPEGEPCLTDGAVDNTNGGCNSNPPVFTNAACGQTWCGTGSTYLSDLGQTRDTDWYLVCHGGGIISATLTSEFPAVVFILDGISDCLPVVVGQAGDSSGCLPGLPASADLPAGQYVVFVAPSIFSGIPCGGNLGNDYSVTISCTAGGCNSNADCPPGEICVGGCCVPAPPVNDLCDDATALSLPAGGQTSIAGTNVAATNEGTPACPGGLPQVGPGVWYSVIGNGNSITAQTCPAGGGSNCCFANGAPGCDDAECQAIVCGVDPFCCDTAWDGICAGEAQDLCGDLCPAVFDTMLTVFCGDCPTQAPPPTSDCCIANGGLGCEDDDCEAIVCAADPFCCATAWDGICADEALDLCGDLCVPDLGGSLCVVGNDDFCGLQSSVTWCAKEGSKYLILVHGFGGATGDFTLTLSDDNAACVPTVDCPVSCFQVISESTECIGASGDFNYHVVGTAACVGNIPLTFDFVGSGGNPGEQMCFDISLYDGGELCCQATVCTTVPDCTPSGQACDLDGDSMIGVTDMLILLAAWNSNPGGPPDYDGDGTVAVSDFLHLLSNWGPCQ